MNRQRDFFRQPQDELSESPDPRQQGVRPPAVVHRITAPRMERRDIELLESLGTRGRKLLDIEVGYCPTCRDHFGRLHFFEYPNHPRERADLSHYNPEPERPPVPPEGGSCKPSPK